MKDVYLKRFLAFLLDLIIVSTIYSTLDTMFMLSFKVTELTLFEKTIEVNYNFTFLAFFIYIIIFDILNKAVTFGKMIFKLKVLYPNKELLVSLLLIRSLLKMITIIIFPISILLYLFKNKFIIQDKYSPLKVISE